MKNYIRIIAAFIALCLGMAPLLANPQLDRINQKIQKIKEERRLIKGRLASLKAAQQPHVAVHSFGNHDTQDSQGTQAAQGDSLERLVYQLEKIRQERRTEQSAKAVFGDHSSPQIPFFEEPRKASTAGASKEASLGHPQLEEKALSPVVVEQKVDKKEDSSIKKMSAVKQYLRMSTTSLIQQAGGVLALYTGNEDEKKASFQQECLKQGKTIEIIGGSELFDAAVKLTIKNEVVAKQYMKSVSLLSKHVHEVTKGYKKKLTEQEFTKLNKLIEHINNILQDVLAIAHEYGLLLSQQELIKVFESEKTMVSILSQASDFLGIAQKPWWKRLTSTLWNNKGKLALLAVGAGAAYFGIPYLWASKSAAAVGSSVAQAASSAGLLDQLRKGAQTLRASGPITNLREKMEAVRGTVKAPVAEVKGWGQWLWSGAKGFANFLSVALPISQARDYVKEKMGHTTASPQEDDKKEEKEGLGRS